MLYLKHPAWLWIKKNRRELIPPVDENLQARFDQGHEFINWSDIKKRCKELQIEEFSNKSNQLQLEKKKQEIEADQPTGMMSYLQTQGWNSLAEAVFYTSKRLYKMNQLPKPGMKSFANYKDMDFNEATEKGWKLGLVDKAL